MIRYYNLAVFRFIRFIRTVFKQLAHRDSYRNDFLQKVKIELENPDTCTQISTLTRTDQIWKLFKLFREYNQYRHKNQNRNRQVNPKEPGRAYVEEKQTIVEYLTLFDLVALECYKIDQRNFLIDGKFPISILSELIAYFALLTNPDINFSLSLVEQAIIVKKNRKLN